MVKYNFFNDQLVIGQYKMPLNTANSLISKAFPQLVMENKIGTEVRNGIIYLTVDWNNVYRVRAVTNFLINKCKTKKNGTTTSEPHRSVK